MAGDPRPIDVHHRIAQLADAGAEFAMALIIDAEGSTPREVGARAIIDANGAIFGTIGGGSVEADVQRRAVVACSAKQPVVIDFDLFDASPSDPGPICGGRLRVLIDPTASSQATAYARAAEALRQRQRGVLITTIQQAEPINVTVQWYADQAIPAEADPPTAQAIHCCLAQEMCQLFRPESQTNAAVFVEPIIPPPALLIIGAGHIGRALARQVVEIGFDVTVLDDRAEFADPRFFPEGVKIRCGSVVDEMAALPMGSETYVVIVTRGHQHDAEALAACIHVPTAYVGMIGSRRKVAMVRKSFLESGSATQAEFDRVFAPVGLNIGAVTVPEIATSIAAQLIAVRRKADGYSTLPKAAS